MVFAERILELRSRLVYALAAVSVMVRVSVDGWQVKRHRMPLSRHGHVVEFEFDGTHWCR